MTTLEEIRAARIDQALKDVQAACSHLRCVSIGLERIDPLEDQADEVAELADRCENVARAIVKHREETALEQGAATC